MRRHLGAMTALALAGTAGTALAQQGFPGQQQMQQGMQQHAGMMQQGQAMGHGSSTRVLNGTIVALKQIPDLASGQTIGIALVRTSGNVMRVVDLGSVTGLANLPLQQNQPLVVSGYVSRIGDRFVLVATDVQSGGQQRQIQRSMTQAASNQSQSGESARPENLRITGMIVGLRQVSLASGTDRNVLALVQTQGGQRLIVDLGSAQSLPQGLQKGQQISVRGREVRVDDRIVLLGHTLAAGNQTYELNRQARLPSSTYRRAGMSASASGMGGQAAIGQGTVMGQPWGQQGATGGSAGTSGSGNMGSMSGVGHLGGLPQNR